MVAGRIQPWRAKDRPHDGLWVFASQMNKAQDRAELRRKFYVALTRVRDRLILTGSPGNAATFDEESGEFAVRFAPDARTMGRMLIEGLRRASWNAGDGAAPWLTESDALSTELGTFKPKREQTPFNPAFLLDNTPLGEFGVAGLRLYHHRCALNRINLHLHSNVRVFERIFQQVLPGRPHHLSSFGGGKHQRRRHHLDGLTIVSEYWLEHIKGWSPNRSCFLFPKGTRARGTMARTNRIWADDAPCS